MVGQMADNAITAVHSHESFVCLVKNNLLKAQWMDGAEAKACSKTAAIASLMTLHVDELAM